MNSYLWRFIDTGSLCGSTNMAIDESLLKLYDSKLSKPILRFYGWKSPFLSLGRFQIADEVLDLNRCRADRIPVVRRISGGGVIFHADELTYSLVCSSEQIHPTSSVKDSFRLLTGFLIDFYLSLGLNASYALDTVSGFEGLGTRTAFCFAGKESFDILIDGVKLGGNAQRRQKNIIFQHGSIPIVNHVSTGLSYMIDRSPEYVQGATSLLECGISTDATVLKTKLVEAFKRRMNVEVLESQLSHEEQQLSQQLINSKYTTDRWNLQGVAG